MKQEELELLERIATKDYDLNEVVISLFKMQVKQTELAEKDKTARQIATSKNEQFQHETIDKLQKIEIQTTRTNGGLLGAKSDIVELKNSKKFVTRMVSIGASIAIVLLTATLSVFGTKIQSSSDFIASRGQVVKDEITQEVKEEIKQHEQREDTIVDYRISKWIEARKNDQLIQNKQNPPLPHP